MKLPIITSAIVALSLMAPSLASQAEGAGAAKTGTATEAGEAHHSEPNAKHHAKRHGHKKHTGHSMMHSKECGSKPGEPCAPGHFCEDK